MSKEEYDELKPGDCVWCFMISFCGSLHGTLANGFIAELEKTKLDDKFEVIQVKKGTKLRVGNIMTVGCWGCAAIEEIFKDYNDGVDYWNSVVRNEVDRLTHYFEEAVKRVNGKILKKRE